ncbi:hypothetical protein [Brevibacterium aurantiacum]|uniref:Transposase n=1 Tax=Brevibacterium aurantiacum TaxID=273384 RepID=A0A556C3B5_BREAU|nr:hypothetical protein [Brevibacterium aurantiacum]TSI11959.1 hypothetical protein FO013_21180 [Brevibacterium aurantiacum]
MARRVYTDEQREEALRLYETDGPSAASKATGISKGTISGWAKSAGVRTSGTQNVREANEAQSENFKARRNRIIGDLYGLAEDTVNLLKEPSQYQTILKGAMGVEGPEMPGFIPAQDKQREITAVGIMLDKALTLESHDASTEEHTAVDAWLAHVMGDV